jgi:hypothetical protein
MVRRRPAHERLQAFVEAYASRLPPAAQLPVAELLLNVHVERLIRGGELPPRPLIELLKPCPLFDITDIADDLITLRPLEDRLRLGVEELLVNPSQEVEKRLRLGRGRVPLAWLLTSHTVVLCGPDGVPHLTQAVKALQGSTEVEVDASTMLVQLKAGSSICNPTESHVRLLPTPVRAIPKPFSKLRTQSRAQTMKKFCSVLDWYFEPFNVQHNPFLLHSAEREVVSADSSSPWRWRLEHLARDFPRVGSAIDHLTSSARYDFLQNVSASGLKHVQPIWLDNGEVMLQLTYEPDFRMPVLGSLLQAGHKGTSWLVLSCFSRHRPQQLS